LLAAAGSRPSLEHAIPVEGGDDHARGPSRRLRNQRYRCLRQLQPDKSCDVDRLDAGAVDGGDRGERASPHWLERDPEKTEIIQSRSSAEEAQVDFNARLAYF